MPSLDSHMMPGNLLAEAVQPQQRLGSDGFWVSHGETVSAAPSDGWFSIGKI